MRLLYALLAPFLIGRLVLGCNTVSPDECWVNTSGGSGGGGTIPIGAGVGATSGDFPADPPRRPLDYGEAPNPCIEPQSPCDEKCLTSYEASAIACSKIANDAQRKTCQDGAYASYRSCHDGCRQASDSTCAEKFQNCSNYAPKSCLAKEAGKSVCNRCLERCNAGDSPSNKCRKCLF
jgi:hypothetical protein